jgi:hypothetical protein
VAFDWAGKSDTGGSITYQFQYYGGSAALLWPLTESAFFLEVGPQLTYGYAFQALPASPSFSSGILGAGGAAMASLPVGPLRLGLDLSLSAQLYRLNDKTVVRPGASAGLLLLFGF